MTAPLLPPPVADVPGFHFAASLLQQLVVPTFVLDHEGRVVIWNKACERLTGVAAHEVLGTPDHWRAFYNDPRPCLADLVLHQQLDRVSGLYAVHQDLVDGAVGYHAENWCIMPRRGNELYLAIDASPLLDSAGRQVAVVETLWDMTHEKVARTELERLAKRDGLTGLSNRHHLDQVLHAEWARLRREQCPLSLLMIDVDHFKAYNDRYGHLAGDECLREIARTLQHALLRPSDVAARYGGEEFAVVLPDTDVQGAETVAHRIQERVEALRLPHAHGEGGRVTLSIGLACVRPKRDTQPEQLVLMADEALYRAKHGGRNRFVVHSLVSPAGDVAPLPPPGP